MKRHITVTTLEGHTVTIHFHPTAFRVWHAVFPAFVPVAAMRDALAKACPPGDDYVYADSRGNAVVASGSLARVMTLCADYIVGSEA